jgi:hypothetical protein
MKEYSDSLNAEEAYRYLWPRPHRLAEEMAIARSRKSSSLLSYPLRSANPWSGGNDRPPSPPRPGTTWGDHPVVGSWPCSIPCGAGAWRPTDGRPHASEALSATLPGWPCRRPESWAKGGLSPKVAIHVGCLGRICKVQP